MAHGTALYRGDQWDAGWATIALADDGTVTVTSVHGTSVVAGVIDDSAFMDVVATGSWLCAVGAKDSTIIAAHSSDGTLRVIGEIPRSEATGAAAVGVHAVRFHDRPGRAQSILAWELGLALLDHEHGIQWATLHHDADCRVLRITADFAELLSPNASLSVALDDGNVVSAEGVTLDVDHETFREWRRGIGK